MPKPRTKAETLVAPACAATATLAPTPATSVPSRTAPIPAPAQPRMPHAKGQRMSSAPYLWTRQTQQQQSKEILYFSILVSAIKPRRHRLYFFYTSNTNTRTFTHTEAIESKKIRWFSVVNLRGFITLSSLLICSLWFSFSFFLHLKIKRKEELTFVNGLPKSLFTSSKSKRGIGFQGLKLAIVEPGF